MTDMNENVVKIEGANSRTETRELSRDICLRIKLTQEKQHRLNAEMRATTLEMQLLQREAVESLGVVTGDHHVEIDPDNCIARLTERLAAD